jgi:hypothetical protein
MPSTACARKKELAAGPSTSREKLSTAECGIKRDLAGPGGPIPLDPRWTDPLALSRAVRGGRNRHDHGAGWSRVSIVCSTVEERLARIGKAIDEVAAAAGTGAGLDDLAARLAHIWSMVADVDPVLAGRLRGYTSGTD